MRSRVNRIFFFAAGMTLCELLLFPGAAGPDFLAGAWIVAIFAIVTEGFA